MFPPFLGKHWINMMLENIYKVMNYILWIAIVKYKWSNKIEFDIIQLL